MQFPKSILLNRWSSVFLKFIPVLFIATLPELASAQDNSPYSRYGLGDLSPHSNVSSRGMGSLSAAYAEPFSINFSNPASYSNFLTSVEPRSKRVNGGRVVLDVGLNFDNRTLIVPNTPNRFSSSDAMFSYMQVGIPIKKNWGMSFGLRPVSRIGYLINRVELLRDPATNNIIDSAITQFKGTGGSYLPTIGTGFGFKVSGRETATRVSKSTLSLGINAGYLFGSRQTSSIRSIIDTALYYSSEHSTNSSFGDLFFNSGLQFQIERTNKIKSRSTIIRLGLSGNWEQTIKGRQDVLRQTLTRGQNGEPFQIDSVQQLTDIPGNFIYPASYKAGFMVQRTNTNQSGWLFGADYTTSKWSSYRFFGQADSVQDNWMLNAGAQFFPRPRLNYFSRVAYRFGFFTGKDYIQVKNELPVMGFSFGLGLPVANYNRLSPNQYTLLNVSLEYIKRGNNDNLLKENLFRLSVGFNFSDLWFGKRRYD